MGKTSESSILTSSWVGYVMKSIDRLVLKELAGPWLFGVGLFSALLIAISFLGQITDYIAQGVPGQLIAELFLLLMPAVLVKTFAMSVLLSSLLAFGRLSSDSEIVALRACGAGLPRIVAGAIWFALMIAGVTFAFNEGVVPVATKHSTELISELAKNVQGNAGKPTSFPQIQDGKIRSFIMAKDFDVSAKTLRGVTIVAYDKQGQRTFTLDAHELYYSGADDWRIRGGAQMISADGATVTSLTGDAWPDAVPKLSTTFQELVTAKPQEGDALSMVELAAQIKRSRLLKDRTTAQIADLEYKFYNKISVPLAALVFGILGAVLGIRNHRTGTATGFGLAIAIIFGYVTLANFMNVWSMRGLLPPWLGSFSPVAIGLAAAGIILWRRNS